MVEVILRSLEFFTFDSYFPGTRNVILDEGTANQRTVYDDIFRFGFLQSVDRVTEGKDKGIKGGWYVIFYNNGDRDGNGNLTEESNRYFFYQKNDKEQLESGHNEGELIKVY